MSKLVVNGGRPLAGTLQVDGAKNAALPILAASIIGKDKITLTNCPALRDVENMRGILGAVGVTSERDGDTLEIDPSGANSYRMPQDLSKELRSSIFMLGPLIARFGYALCTYPGGCEIGHRPIDLHLRGLSMLGVRIQDDSGLIICDGTHMHPADIYLDYPSVGATENIMMAAVSIDGEVNIHNTAREPEIEDLQDFLCGLGCDVSGAGTSHICIRGGARKSAPYVHQVTPDRIVAGTLLCGAAMTDGDITLENVRAKHLDAVLSKLAEAGCRLVCETNRIRIIAPERLSELRLIETLPYPGFPTDMQAQFFSLCTLAKGTSMIVENVFENRFKHGPELARMGAMYTQRDRTVVIRGTERLTGTVVNAHDLRAGAAQARRWCLRGLRPRAKLRYYVLSRLTGDTCALRICSMRLARACAGKSRVHA